ncbi:MAG: ATP-dependent Clp protease ATP-binding subunit [Polyangiaceae bacterium]|jgi:ATP-dependent Clp protease ATP-binding subunit ClpB|nr:ATP-dependent Clp protease ATP-binding subunit [Polyangiaceae bacterium]
MAAEEISTTLHLESYTPEAKEVVASSQALADELRHVEVEPIHLLVRALQRDRGVGEVVRRSGADPAELLATAETALRRLSKTGGGVAYLSTALLDLLRRAEREAQREKAPTTGLEQLLVALSQEIRGAAGEALSAYGLQPGCFRPHLGALRTAPAAREAAPGGGEAGGAAGGSDIVTRFTRDLAADARAGDPVIGRTAEVRRVLQILERRAKNHPLLVGEPGVGKSAILRALALRIASGDVPSNLVGVRLLELESGAIMAGAKLRGEVEDRIKALARQLAAERSKGEAIVIIEGLSDLLGSGVVGSGVGDVLRPLLARGELRVVATTTPEGVRKMQDRDTGLLRRFSPVPVEPATIGQAQEIVRGVATRYERHHQVRIGEGAVGAAVRLAARYVQERALPDSALDLLDETAAKKRVENEGVPAAVDEAERRLESLKAQRDALADDTDRASVDERGRIDRDIGALEPELARLRAEHGARRGARAAEAALRQELTSVEAALETARRDKNAARAGELEYVTLPDVRRRLEAARAASERQGAAGPDNFVSEEDVARTLESWTGIPTQRMLEAEADKLLKMEERLRRRVVGQDEAVGALSRAVRRGRVGLRDPGKPIGSFFFLGPSGVGKTELAKALAEFLFDDEQALTRLDMSEFMERHMAQRLLGAPPGYVDSEQGGFLTEAVRRRPYSVLLFDEVEKAHADVFNLLLQVLDDGRLTDGRGRTVDFSNTVVIMTSNIGSGRILETDAKIFDSEDGRQAVRDVLLEEMKAFFRPEFLNRVDDVIVFRPLRKADLLGIVDIQLGRLGRLLDHRRLRLTLSDKAKERLVDVSYEPAMGARPLRRTMVKELQDPLAEAILSAGYPEGTSLYVDVREGEFTFEDAAKRGAAARG